MADSAAALDAPEEVWEHYRDLVKQAGILFGARHYTNSRFLLTLSDHVAHFGSEQKTQSEGWEPFLHATICNFNV